MSNMVQTTYVDKIKYLYYEVRDRMIPEVDVLENDITDVVWETIYNKLSNNEIPILNCTGEVATGKSTVMAIIRYRVNNFIIANGYTQTPIIPRETFYMDETEFINSINAIIGKKRQEDKIFIQIDDRNSMGEGYLNATTDRQLFDTFSDMFAQHNITRGYCSPSDSPDKNALIWLEVIGRNKEAMTTTCKVIYNNVMEKQQLTVGRMVFDVSEVINEPWYKEERRRKFERHSLIHKYGIRDIRDLLFAPIVTESFGRLKRIARSGKINKDILIATVEDVARQQKRFLSQLTLMNIANRVSSLTTLLSEIDIAKKKRDKAQAKGDNETLELQKERLDDLTTMFNNRLASEVQLEDLYGTYRSI